MQVQVGFIGRINALTVDDSGAISGGSDPHKFGRPAGYKKRAGEEDEERRFY